MPTVFKLAVDPSATVATAYYANSARILSQVAATLGKHDDSRYYSELSAKVAAAWRAKFVRQEGKRIGENKQDDYVRALDFELLLPSHRTGAITRLVELIEEASFHLQTGFLSTPMLLPVLAAHGRVDVAFRLLLQDTPLSWLYQVERGATTIWETWEGYNEKGDAKASHNH
jgi:alpha-L-rhamnosidase